MRFVKYAIVIALLLAVSRGGPLPAAQETGPKISATELNYDFGNVVQGAEASHEFVFGNAGNAELVIEQVQTS